MHHISLVREGWQSGLLAKEEQNLKSALQKVYAGENLPVKIVWILP